MTLKLYRDNLVLATNYAYKMCEDTISSCFNRTIRDVLGDFVSIIV